MSFSKASSDEQDFNRIDCRRLEAATVVDVVHFLDEVPSTNDWAHRELARSNRGSQSELFIAQTQTAGRGRGSNSWQSATGSLTFTLVLPRPFPIGDPRHQWIPLAVGCGICQTIDATDAGLSPSIKWPNDVMLDDKKVAGVLVETSMKSQGRADGVDSLVIGCGVNVNNSFQSDWNGEEMGERSFSAISVAEGLRAATKNELAQCAIDLTSFAARAVNSIVGAIELLVNDAEWIVKYVQQKDWLNGRRVHWQTGLGDSEKTVHGTTIGICDDGSLLLLVDNMKQKVVTGSIRAID